MSLAADLDGLLAAGDQLGPRLLDGDVRPADPAGASTEHKTVNRRDPQTELVYQNVRQHHYDFCSNTLVALIVLWLSWLPSQLPVLTEWSFSWATAKPIVVTLLGGAAGWVL